MSLALFRNAVESTSSAYWVLDDLVLGGHHDALLIGLVRLDHLPGDELPGRALSRVIALQLHLDQVQSIR